ncbi:hypothetical protein BLOT_010091 [Blomia tropicalis]|nr:hypothetical protein BLOT_010091 [Blomia tropicalis]
MLISDFCKYWQNKGKHTRTKKFQNGRFGKSINTNKYNNNKMMKISLETKIWVKTKTKLNQ